MVASWFRNLVARSNRYPVRKPASTRTERRARLNVEALEDRRLMSVTVPSSLSIPAFGNLTVPLGQNSVTVDNSGNFVADVHIKSGSFNVAGAKFGVQDLEVQYTSATKEFDIRGTASASIGDTNGITATFGSPDTFGIVLVDNGQTLQSLSGSLSLTKPLTFGPTTLTLTSASVDYFPKTGELDLGGSASLTTARNGPTLSVALGDASSETKGIVIHNGRLTALNATVNGSFTTAGLSVAAHNMTLSYSQRGQTFDISGRADLTVAGNQFHITVPTNGIVIQNGVLQSLSASVDGDVRVGKAASLSLRTASVSYSGKQDQLAFWGAVQFSAPSLPGGSFQATLGTSQASPGMTFVHGQLKSLDVTLDGGFLDMGGTHAAVKDLHVVYAGAQLQVSGGVDLALGPTFHGSATISNQTPITIDTKTGAVSFNGVDASLDVKVGSVEFNATVSYSEDSNHVISVSANGTVTLPTTQVIAGGFQFVHGRLQEIDLSWDAGNSLGFAVGDTGLFVTHVGGQLTNFSSLSNLMGQITVGVTYGEKITVLGHQYDLFDAMGTLTVSKGELDLNGTLNIAGGRKSGFGQSITADVKLDWADGIYSADIHGLAISMGNGIPLFTVDGSMTVEGTGITITGTATPDLPQEILNQLPQALQTLVNGNTPNATFVMHYAPHAKNDYIQATASVPVLGSVTVTQTFDGSIAASWVDGALAGATKFLRGIEADFQTLLSETDHGFQTLEETWDRLGDHVKETWTQVNGKIQDIRDAWTADGKHAETILVNGVLAEEKDFDTAGDYVEKVFVHGAPFVVGSFDAAGHKISGVIGSAWHTVVSDAESAANALKNAGQDVVNQVASWL